MSTSRRFSITSLRAVHAGISAFVAPMLIFYSLSGSLQLFDLHEAHGTYVPSPAIAAIGRLHKDQVLAPPPPRPAQPGSQKQAPPKAEKPTPLAVTALKILFLLEALALVFTTLIGVYVGVTHPKYARRSWILLALGIVIPGMLIVI